MNKMKLISQAKACVIPLKYNDLDTDMGVPQTGVSVFLNITELPLERLQQPVYTVRLF